VYRRICLVAMMIWVGACGGAGGQDGTPSGQETPTLDEAAQRALEAELVEADRDFAKAVERNGLGGWIAAFAPGGRMIGNGESYIGLEAIRRTMLPVFADSTFSLTWDPIYAEVAASGDLGYTVGSYKASSGSGDSATRQEGTYLTVWRRQPNGAWRVQADIGNPAPDN
jgi:ketosteroid isomerase-like protein